MWTFERGSKDRKFWVRAKFTVPERCLGRLKEGGRKITYGSQIAQHIWIAVNIDAASKETAFRTKVVPETILTYIEGRHIKPIPVPLSQVNGELRKEPFGQYLATTANRAHTLTELITTSLPDYTWLAFAADEGIGIKFIKERTKARVRLVIICTPRSPTRAPNSSSKMAVPETLVNQVFVKPTLTIVAVAPSDDPTNIDSTRSILQVASYDEGLGWFNFYDVSVQSTIRLPIYH